MHTITLEVYSVDERLPVFAGDYTVFVTMPNTGHRETFTAFYAPTNKSWCSGGMKIKNVTHWCYMPKTLQENNNAN